MIEQVVRELDAATAWQRLATVNVGRLATSIGALPMVLPVHYLVDRDRLLFAVEPGSAVARGLDGGVFAFESSGRDRSLEAWWSVLVRGRATVLPEDDPSCRRLEALQLSTPVWPAMGETVLVRAGEVGSVGHLHALAAFLARDGASPWPT